MVSLNAGTRKPPVVHTSWLFCPVSHPTPASDGPPLCGVFASKGLKIVGFALALGRWSLTRIPFTRSVLTLLFLSVATLAAFASCFCRGGEEGAVRRVPGAPPERETSTPSGGRSRKMIWRARGELFVQRDDPKRDSAFTVRCPRRVTRRCRPAPLPRRVGRVW